MSQVSPDPEYQPFHALPPRRRRSTCAQEPTSPAPPTPPPPPNLTPEARIELRRARRAQKRGLPRIGAPWIVLAFAAVLVAGALFGYQWYLRDRAVPGVRVLGEEIGGMTRAQAETLIREKLGDPNVLLERFGGEQIILRDGSNVYRAWPWELGFRSDLRPALDAAFAIGHRGDLTLSLIEQGRALLVGADVTASSAFDDAVARQYVSVLALQIDRPSRDALYRLEGLRLTEQPAQAGRRLDGEETFKRIKAFAANPGGEVMLPVQDLVPNAVDAKQAQTQINAFLAAPLVLQFRERSWAIDQAALAQMLTLQPVSNADGSQSYKAVLNDAAIRAKVEQLAREINQSPRDARFHFTDGVLTPIVTSQEGRALDIDATTQAVALKFQQASASRRVQGNASPGETALNALRENTIELAVTVTKPAVDVRDAANFGIKELVSSGTSQFRGSIPSRIVNINTAQKSFDGVVIPPGATFSFIKYLSEIVEANGYEDAYVIFGDRTVLGPGGGVCQVSTTMFRAAFFAGFPIAERWEHAYRVGYYEPPKGLDAAVFVPSADLKFVNDTPNYILIESVADIPNLKLTFNFYGTKPNGREVRMTEPEVTNKVPHPPTKYIDDPNLPRGTTKQIDFAVDGEDVTLYREIYQDGQLVTRQKFFSRYEPWQAVYLRGTK
ncbi:MAG: VanW family protein [Anaerolineae bacterium]|nr:VanW family protein [Anaerolineae bacterium]